MTDDQRFAATRTDVLVYKTAVLDRDISVFGPIPVELNVSTSATDSDFVVKLIDVYPENAEVPAMSGYQQLVRGEPFRGHNLALTRARGTDHCAGEAAFLDFEAGAQDVSDTQIAGSGSDLIGSRR